MRALNSNMLKGPRAQITSSALESLKRSAVFSFLFPLLVPLSGIVMASVAKFPFLNRLPPAELVAEGSKAVLPQDVKLRPVFTPGLKVTKQSEGWEPQLYDDAVHYCTIGYGHLVKKSPCNGTEPEEFRKGITEMFGEALLVTDMGSAQYAVMTMVKLAPKDLSDGQFAALADFVFNVGSANFKASTLLQVVNTKQEDRVASQFRRWTLAGGKAWPGLKKRRENEIVLYFSGRPTPKGIPPQGERLSPIDIRKGEQRDLP